MSRFSWRTENQWPALREGANVDLLRFKFGANRWRAGFSVHVLGFGVALTYWRMAFRAEPQGREHGA